jgi:diguanylate cyclase (GGDEF)-like protein/PAS domain S-box-containing protein
MTDERPAGQRLLWSSEVLRRRVVRGSTALAGISAVWFVVSLVRPSIAVWQRPVVVLGSALAGLACLIAAASAKCTAVRRFWQLFALGTVVSTAATVVQAYHLMAGSELTSRQRPVPEMALFLLGMVIEGWALYRLPFGTRTRSETLTLWLDAGTVMSGATLFGWAFLYRPAQAGEHHWEGLVVAFGTVVFGLLVLFAMVKVAMAHDPVVDKTAVRLMAGALIIGIVGSVPDMVLAGHTRVTATQLSLPLTYLVAVLAARAQWRAGTVPPASAASRRRLRVLPYVAVAATDVLLLWTARTLDRNDQLVVAAGAVLVTGLVVGRQVMAFAEINRLLTRLDEKMGELSTAELRFRSMVQNAFDIITDTDEDGFLTYVSPSAATVLGRTPESWVGMRAREYVHPDDLPMVQREVARTRQRHGQSVVYQARILHADGRWRWMEITSANLVHEPGLAGVVSNGRDITEAREFQRRLRHRADHDPLTGLANRALFADRVQRMLKADGSPRPAMVLIDLNDFKAVNDSLGHAVGDALLVATADRLRLLLPYRPMVSRLGGDEFALLLDGVTEEELAEIGPRLVAAFEPPVLIDGHQLTVAASIGIAESVPAADADELLRRADLAMYAAKFGGESEQTRWARYTPSMEATFGTRLRLEAGLRQALEAGQLHVAYQPIIDLRSGEPAAAEALVRWSHPDLGSIAPDRFVPVAERIGVIVPLGRWVLREACTQAAQWRREYGDRAPSVSVNVSARQLREADFSAHVLTVLEDTGLPADHLTVEVTESMSVDREASFANLDRMHNAGVRISLDDFGTGRSDLTMLHRCPVDEVKLDRSFTLTCIDPDRQQVAVAVIELAAALGLEAVAEGVESKAQAATLADLGYRLGQGYHFAPPLTPEEMTAFIRSPRALALSD